MPLSEPKDPELEAIDTLPPAATAADPTITPAKTSAHAPAPGPQTSHSTNFHRSCRGWVKSEGVGAGARLRLGLIFALLLLAYGGLCLRLAQIQIVEGRGWKEKQIGQQLVREVSPEQRGMISDRNFLPLAFCIPRQIIIADLKLLKDQTQRRAAAERLAPLLGLSPASLYEKTRHDDRRVVYLARNVDDDTAEKIRQLKLSGIGFEDEFRRAYPQASLACHVLGWAGDSGGSNGIELELNSILEGTPGYQRYYRDAAKRLIALDDASVGPLSNHPPRAGLSLSLTLDARIQHAAEEELQKIQREYQPKSATCIVLDVSNGAILAMACTPVFDPNEPAKSTPETWRNRIITDIYEPGSTFKTFVAATALEHKLWKRSDVIFCENGAWPLGYRVLHDSHAYGPLSFDDVIAKSSNIGAAKIAVRLGLDTLHQSVRAFGFGEKTRLNLPGERDGLVHPRSRWRRDSIYSVAMGHEICVTPIQLATAYAAVVNGGLLYRPKIVQRILSEQGQELYALHPQPLRRVISEQTSQHMREILGRVVLPGGTGTKAFCPEYALGGKTGTTKKIDPATGQYSSSLYVSSFCGFAPVEHPRLVCLVTVDEPQKGSGYYGGTVCCPAVREVLRKGLSVLNVPPRSADDQKKAIAASKAVAR